MRIKLGNLAFFIDINNDNNNAANDGDDNNLMIILYILHDLFTKYLGPTICIFSCYLTFLRATFLLFRT